MLPKFLAWQTEQKQTISPARSNPALAGYQYLRDGRASVSFRDTGVLLEPNNDLLADAHVAQIALDEVRGEPDAGVPSA